jgi:hypothetical protein
MNASLSVNRRPVRAQHVRAGALLVARHDEVPHLAGVVLELAGEIRQGEEEVDVRAPQEREDLLHLLLLAGVEGLLEPPPQVLPVDVADLRAVASAPLDLDPEAAAGDREEPLRAGGERALVEREAGVGRERLVDDRVRVGDLVEGRRQLDRGQIRLGAQLLEQLGDQPQGVVDLLGRGERRGGVHRGASSSGDDGRQ